MRLLDIMNSPWAITEEKFAVIQSIYLRHVQGEKIDLEELEAQIGKPLDNQQEDCQIVNGVAIICLEGPIAKRMNLMTAISGGVSSQILQDQVNAAVNNPEVKSILLYIDSPGGTVDGTQALSNTIREARAKKPVCALVDGMMASAAYWIGSAADKIYISSETDLVGSIGVVATHVDTSKAEEMDGVKVTEITAGKYKRAASQHEPLSKDGRAEIQDQVDEVYSVFIRDVAKNRGITEEKALAMADGKKFIGQAAIDIGLVDGIKSINELVSELSNMEHDMKQQPMKMAASSEVIGMSISGVSSAANSTIITTTDNTGTVQYIPTVTADPIVTVRVNPIIVEPAIKEVPAETPAGGEATEAPKATEVSDPPQAQDRDAANGEQMNFEAYFREALGLAADADLKEAIDTVASTQKTLADKKGEGYVALLNYNMKVTECNSLKTKLAASEKANSDLENKHFKELRQRDADDAVKTAIASGKLTVNEATEWGNEMAVENPKMFNKVIENRPEVIAVEGARPGKIETPVASTKASIEFRALVAELQKEAREKGKPIGLRDAQRAVAEKNPSLYEQVQNESRNFNGAR